MIKAIIFDLDGTLLNRDRSVEIFIGQQYERFYTRMASVSKEKFVNRFIELDNRGYVWKDQVYKQLIDDFDIHRITWEELLRDYLNHFKECCIPFPNLVETLKKLQKSHFLMGMITNGKGNFQMDNIKAMNVDQYMDTILISEWEGIKKPDPLIFRRAADRLQVSPEECVFIGDHPEKDVKAAKDAGMTAVWKKDEYWNEVKSDYSIEDLREIHQLVRQLNACTG